VRCGRSIADPPDDPVVVEAVREFAERLVEFLDGPESVQPEQLLLQGPDEPLDAAVALGLADEGRARLDPEGLELALEGVRDELAAMVVAELRARADALLVVALDEVDRLAEAIHCLESRAAPRGAHPEAFARAVVDDHEDRSVSLVGEAAGSVDGPHLVGVRGGDRAVVGVWPAHAGRAVAGEDAVLAHDPEHTAHRGAHAALLPEPRPDLAVAFADEERGCEDGADLGEDLLIGEEGLRAAFRGDPRRIIRLRLVALDGGAGEPPRAADAQDAVGLLRGG
jgi:hypothetical protein